MTRAEILAFNSGVRTALEAARAAAQALRAKNGSKPTREGAIDALDELAEAGRALLIDDTDTPPGALTPKKGDRLMTDEAENIARFLIFDRQQKNIESYVNRGRAFASASIDYLNQQFVLELKRWASTPPPWEPLTRLDDIESEFALRKIEPPWSDEVRESLETVNAMVNRAIKEQLGQPNTTYFDERLRDYYEAQAKKN